jgi:hypothetical protein
MNKRTKGLLLVFGFFIVVFVIMVYVAIPKMAALALPFRWGTVPLDQPRTLVRQYYGRPADTSVALTDEWRAARENGEYVLKINYGKDSIATSYKLYFNYHLAFFSKQYLLVEK